MIERIYLWKSFEISEESELEHTIKNGKSSSEKIPTEITSCLTVYQHFLPDLKRDYYGRWVLILTPEQTGEKYKIFIGPPTKGTTIVDAVKQLQEKYPNVTPFVMPLLDDAGIYSPRGS